ncbi:MAG TPA: hypothetical protein EYP78_07105, partial [Candidatus Omnitrophica bacterium]|nr:hypothetical protein [Candidatus Omnitrophota bacterium]
MRIKKILIDRAYPLTESFYMEPADFNLIFGGKNESGKTLLFDIMTYLLFRKDIFKHRREIDVKGEIHVEKDGKTIICKGDKELLRGILTEQATTNIFCLRATEFSLIEKPQERKNWWNYVKESLSDMTDINEITSSVKKLSFLTPTETISIGKSKEIEESKKKVGEIESLLKSDVYIKIRDYERLKSKLAQLKDKMWKLEVAQAEKKFRQSSDLLETLKTKREKVEKDFGEIEEQNLSKLIEMETTIKNLQERVGEVKRGIEETKNEMIELDRKYELIENEEHLYADFNPESFRQPLTEIEEMERELAKESFFLRDRWLLPFLTGFGLLFILAGLILKPWIALIGAVIGTLPWIIKLNKEKKEEYLNEMRRTKFNELKKMLAPFTDSIENIEDSLALKIKLDELERKKKQAHDLSISIKEKRKSQQKEREKREKILKDRMERLTEEQSRHREFLRKKGCKRREELESKIKEKNKLQKDIDKIYSEISSILTEADEEKWGRRLLDLKEKAQRLPKEAIPEFTEENLRETKDEISNIEKKLTELSSSVEKYRELLLLLG